MGHLIIGVEMLNEAVKRVPDQDPETADAVPVTVGSVESGSSCPALSFLVGPYTVGVTPAPPEERP